MIWRRIFALYKAHYIWLTLATLLAFITVMANVALLATASWFISAMAVAGATGAAINYFTPAAIIRALAIVRTAGRYGERIVSHEATFRLISELRVWFYRRIEPLAPAGLQRHQSGELLNHLQKDIDRLDAAYLRIAQPIIVAILTTLTITLMMASYSWTLAAANLLLMIAAGLFLPLSIKRLCEKPAKQQVKLAGQLRNQLVGSLQGMGELISHQADSRQQATLEATNKEWLRQQDQINRYQSLANASIGLFSHLALWSALFIAIPLINAGEIHAVNLAMLGMLALAGFEALLPLPAAFELISETQEAAKRLFSIADSKPVVTAPTEPKELPNDNAIAFESVHFCYPDNNAEALVNANFSLDNGSRTLVTGRSGSGKTSLINLMMRFWQPQDGNIRLGGIDIRELDEEDLRSRLSLVSQHTHLINGSVRDNLLLAAPNADEEALINACKTAQIHDLLESLPQGYNTWVGETGVKFSGGEAQRLSIARAILKQAPILLLDEPTEGLDTITEQKVMKALHQLMHDKTVLLISHRKLSLDGFNQRLHLDQGQLIQQPA